MKRFIAGILLFAAVLLAASCAFYTGGTEDTGSVSMNFALTPGTRAVTDDHVRVWVYSNNALIQNRAAGTPYFSGALSAGKGSVTIDGLPPGSGYRIVVAAGTLSGTGVFDTTRFGASGIFNLSAGLEAEVKFPNGLIELTMNSAPVLADLNVKSVVSVFGGIAAATSNKIFGGADAAGIAEAATAPTGTVFNSLSIGTEESESEVLLVNKSNGVDKITTPGGTRTAVANFPDGAPSVLQSGAFNGVYFYQAEREFGGRLSGAADWLQIDLDIQGMTGRPVMDFFVTEKPASGIVPASVTGFFATRIVGAMRMGQDFIEADLDDPLQEILDGESTLLKFFGADLPLIQAFGYLGGTARTLFLGTKNGVYQTTAEFGTTAIGPASLVEGTKGLNVTKIAKTTVETTVLSAYMSETEVVVLKNNLVYLLPFVNGMTGTINDIAWKGTKLYVAGAKGLAEIETSTW
jgi:hypothetical protein